MNRSIYIGFMTVIAFLLMGCPAKENNGETADAKPPVQTVPEGHLAGTPLPYEQDAFRIYPLEGSHPYQEAQLMHGPLEVSETGEAAFNFEVTNYLLGDQTPGAEGILLANSAKGQHIHLIVNNGPYSAHYDGAFNKQLDPGNNVILAFLSRSYHESVKNGHAFYVTQTNVAGAEGSDPVDLNAPHMFYSRPKGEYKGEANTQRVLLDFFILNGSLTPDDKRVRATINEHVVVLDQWIPYVMEGLPMGENTVKLEFLDSQGQLIPSPFNPVERTFTLSPGDAEM